MRASSARRSRRCLPAGRGTRRPRRNFASWACGWSRSALCFERMSYDKDVVAVQAGKPVEFVLENNDSDAAQLRDPRAGLARGDRHVFGSPRPAAGICRAATTFRGRRRFWCRASCCSRAIRKKMSFDGTDRDRGSIPIVCTYPGHWRRMYGALVRGRRSRRLSGRSRKVRGERRGSTPRGCTA